MAKQYKERTLMKRYKTKSKFLANLGLISLNGL